MWLKKLSKHWLARWVAAPESSKARRQPARRHGLRLALEQLEDRTLMSNYSAATVSDLIADINAANQGGGSNTITLVAPATSPYVLAAVNNTTDGATGLPVIAANDNLTIIGNADTIQRSAAAAFRLFDVAGGGSLTLQNLTLQGGLAFGRGVAAEGGAVYSQGSLHLGGVTVQNNTAQGQNGTWLAGYAAAGGGIYSSGTLTLDASTFQNNLAQGGRGGPNSYWLTAGGNGLGGGVYVAGGTARLTGVTITSNSAWGGLGGFAFHHIGPSGLGEGGGIYIDPAALVYLDAFTVANIINNAASTSDPNIHGPWKPY